MDGIIVADKPGGKTSCWAVSQVKRILAEKKAGHAGTLDPLATGVLVIGLGFATRILRYVESFDKEYTGVIRLGVTTETDDAEGRITGESLVPAVSREKWDGVLCSFTGKLMQTPPCFSAVKICGERAYARARRGEVFETKPREVLIHELTLVRWDPGGSLAEVRVRCSKGTYIRSLARDIGAALGCGGHLASLRRERIGPFSRERSVRLSATPPVAESRDLEKALLPLESALAGFECFVADKGKEGSLTRGQAVEFDGGRALSGREVLVKTGAGDPLCLGRVDAQGGRTVLTPVRMLKGI
jgi:tRNA pseudouridine55 synthase